jgi:hypothetical protein
VCFDNRGRSFFVLCGLDSTAGLRLVKKLLEKQRSNIARLPSISERTTMSIIDVRITTYSQLPVMTSQGTISHT